MGPEDVKLFDSAALHPGGSVRFPLGMTTSGFGPVQREGFAIRLADGSIRAWHNVCPHRGQPVDLGDGRLFTGSGALECHAHGAVFDPASGACQSGPCFGRALTPLRVEERDGAVWLVPDCVEEDF